MSFGEISDDQPMSIQIEEGNCSSSRQMDLISDIQLTPLENSQQNTTDQSNSEGVYSLFETCLKDLLWLVRNYNNLCVHPPSPRQRWNGYPASGLICALNVMLYRRIHGELSGQTKEAEMTAESSDSSGRSIWWSREVPSHGCLETWTCVVILKVMYDCVSTLIMGYSRFVWNNCASVHWRLYIPCSWSLRLLGSLRGLEQLCIGALKKFNYFVTSGSPGSFERSVSTTSSKSRSSLRFVQWFCYRSVTFMCTTLPLVCRWSSWECLTFENFKICYNYCIIFQEMVIKSQ